MSVVAELLDEALGKITFVCAHPATKEGSVHSQSKLGNQSGVGKRVSVLTIQALPSFGDLL